MYQLVTSQFEEFENALRGVQGRFVLRSRKQTDWELRVVDLNGVSLSFGKAGAAHFYNGAGSAGQFTFFVLLSRHEDFTLDGVQFDRRKVGWLIPERSFHAFARRPLTALSVTISGDRVFVLAFEPPDEVRTHALLMPKFREVCRARGRKVRSTGRSDFCLGQGLVNRPVAIRQQRRRLGTRCSEPYSKRSSRAMTKSRLVVRSSTDRPSSRVRWK